MSPRKDDQGSDSSSYLSHDGGVLPFAGGPQGPQFVGAVERAPLELYSVVRKTGVIDSYAGWQLGSYVPCDERQVPGDAYDVGGPVDVGGSNQITWFIDYVPPVDQLTPAHVLSCIMEVSNGGARWRAYTLLDNNFTQNNLRGNAAQPEPIGVGSFFATRYVYASEVRSPNMLGADLPADPYGINRRIDQPTFSSNAGVAPSPAAELPQLAPVGFHFTYDVTPFTAVRLRWKHLQVDADGAYVAEGIYSTVDPRDPALNGFTTIHYGLVTG